MTPLLGVSRRRVAPQPQPPTVFPLGPRPVDLSPVGAVRTASTAAELVAAVNAVAAGSTVVASGVYGALALSRSIASGFIRVIPSAAGALTVGRLDLSGAQGLDLRGINTTGEVYYASSRRIRWRGGTSRPGRSGTGHNIRQSCDDVVIEDFYVIDPLNGCYFYADRDSTASTNITVQRGRTQNVAQDHYFVGRARFLTLQDFEAFGNTESSEHQDGVQVVGGKDMTIRRGHIWNLRSFRDAAIDRNDHGLMFNYDPSEVGAGGTAGRVPERITVEDMLIHDMTSHGMALAGGWHIAYRNNTVYDNGPNGSTQALSVAPDAGNSIIIDDVRNNVFNRWTQAGATMTAESHNFVGDGSGPAGTSRLTGDPGFVNRAGQDYRLAATSQNRLSGTATNAAVFDLYQTTRPSPPSRGAIEVVPAAADTTAPSAPTGLSANASGLAISLSWSAATDNVGVTAYRIKRDGVTIVDNHPSTSYVDSGLAASTSYSYTVAARDAAGNYSLESSSAGATTGTGTVTPSVVGTPTSSYVFGASLAVAKPAGTLQDQVMWAWINAHYNTPITATPDGWELVDSFNQTSGALGGWWYLYRKPAGASEPSSYTWGFSTGQNQWGAIISTKDVSLTSPINAGGTINSTVNSLSHAMSAITPGVANTLILAFYSNRSTSATPQAYTQPSGMTEVLDRSDNYSGIGIASLTGVGAGVSTGTRTASVPTTAGEWGGVLIALAPAG